MAACAATSADPEGARLGVEQRSPKMPGQLERHLRRVHPLIDHAQQVGREGVQVDPLAQASVPLPTHRMLLVHVWSTRQRFRAVRNGLQRCILVQVAGGILRMRGRVQSADKDEVGGSSPPRPTTSDNEAVPDATLSGAGAAGRGPG
jgi:hypothetical protein